MISPRFAIIWMAALPFYIWAQSVNKVHLGFPEAWDGDKYRELYCPSKNIPKFLDGYFLCQLSAAYGNQTAKPGQKLTHMIDAIGAVGAFHISNGQVIFSSQYYPSRPYKIWEFYDRNMSKASVPWAGWSDYNITAMTRWEQVPSNPDSARFHPNLDFWKVGNRVVAGTEAPYWVGYEFDVRTLSKFKLFPFNEQNDIFGNPRPTMIPISMAIHERNDKDGTIWGSFSAMNFHEQRFYQGIFTVDSNGVRKVVGMYDYGTWDANACGKDDEYIGDKTLLPGYIHSITSTDQYIILPITSLLINPCKFKEPPMSNIKSPIQKGGLWGMDFYDMVPMRFLIFNKKTHEWVTQKPLEVFPSMFVTHQLNAFENPDGTIVADMIVYDSHDPYVKYFYTEFLTKQLYPSTARILRFTLDIKEHRVMYNYLIPQETIAGDFPQINHAFEGRAYQWAYLIEHPFASDNVILKINVDDPAGSRNLKFKGDPSLVLHEPWFVPRPDARKEDDGVLLVRALDLSENKGILLVIDATTMTEIGRAYVPISIPFGFHNRFFSKPELGLPEGFSVNQFRPTVPTTALPPTSPITALWTKITAETTEKLPESSEPPTVQSSPPTKWTPFQTTSSSFEKPSEGPTEKPWWQRVQSTTTEYTFFTRRPNPSSPRRPVSSERTRLPPHPETRAPEMMTPVTSRPRPTTMRTLPPKSPLVPDQSANTISPPPSNAKLQTVKELYEETLKALCRWLPKVFKSISQESCLDNGYKALKWMIPMASSYADRMPDIPSRDDPFANLPNLRPEFYRSLYRQAQARARALIR